MIELVSVLGHKLSLTGVPGSNIADLDLGYVGSTIVGLFVVTWLAALAVWRFGRVAEKWTAHLTRGALAEATPD